MEYIASVQKIKKKFSIRKLIFRLIEYTWGYRSFKRKNYIPEVLPNQYYSAMAKKWNPNVLIVQGFGQNPDSSKWFYGMGKTRLYTAHTPSSSVHWFPSHFLSCLSSNTTDVPCITYQIYPVPSLPSLWNPSSLAFFLLPPSKTTLLPASIAFWSASRKNNNTTLFYSS